MKIINKICLTAVIIILFGSVAFAKLFPDLHSKVEYYKNRYNVQCLSEKITDNHGNGFESLYGTRNMRTILYGVAYRGGANNAFHKTHKRDNHNPLPDDGLDNLLDEGFSTAIYLYSTNFKGNRALVSHEEHGGRTYHADTIDYIQNSGNSRKDMKKILGLVFDAINDPSKGPIYLHCWNGWHQSGYVSSAILKQFCKFSDDDAINYWIKNTDGVNKGYDRVKSQVREFKPFPEYKIDDATRREICPCNDSKK
jgi:hypothetical protein